MDVNAFVFGVDFLHRTESANLNIRRALTQHTFDCDAVTRLNLIAQRSLGGLLFVRPAKEPISPTDENLGLVIMTAPHCTNDPVLRHVVAP